MGQRKARQRRLCISVLLLGAAFAASCSGRVSDSQSSANPGGAVGAPSTAGGDDSTGGVAAVTDGTAGGSPSTGGKLLTGGQSAGAAPGSEGGLTTGGQGDAGSHPGGAPGGGTAGQPEAGGSGYYDGVGVGGQTMLCNSNAIAGGIWSCSAEEACAALDCGEIWSEFDEDGCRKDLEFCSADTDCTASKRCVPNPVLGNFREPFQIGYDSCAIQRGRCVCQRYPEDVAGTCLSLTEYPSEQDCPVESLDCDALAQAASSLQAFMEMAAESWRDGIPDGPGTAVELARACQAKVNARLVDCPPIPDPLFTRALPSPARPPPALPPK